jgi:hypothetical protein
MPPPPPGASPAHPTGPRFCHRTGAPRRAAPCIGTRARAPLGCPDPAGLADTGWQVRPSPRARPAAEGRAAARHPPGCVFRGRAPLGSPTGRGRVLRGRDEPRGAGSHSPAGKDVPDVHRHGSTVGVPCVWVPCQALRCVVCSLACSRSFLLSHLPGRQNSYARLRFCSCVG